MVLAAACGGSSGTDSDGAATAGDSSVAPSSGSSAGGQGASSSSGGAPAGSGGGTTTTASGGGAPSPDPNVDWTANKFVAPDASGSGDGTEANPWTLQQAMANAVAGDIVEVAPGVYVGASTGLRYEPAFMPASSGAADAPIVFFARYPAVHNTSQRSELRNDAPSIDTGSPTFGAGAARDYIIWDGFYVDEAYAHSTPDTGPVTDFGGYHVGFYRNVIKGESIPRMDNHTGIRLEGVVDVQIVNNEIFGFQSSAAPSQNFVGVQAYDADQVTIEHNYLHDNDVDLFPKGWHGQVETPLTSWTMRYNRMEGARWVAIHIISLGSIADRPRSVIANNVIVGANFALYFHVFNADTPRDIDFVNNTVVDSVQAASFNWGDITGHQHVRVLRNLFVGAPYGWDYSQISGTTLSLMKANDFDIDDNHYAGQSNAIATIGDPSGGTFATTAEFATATEYGQPGTGFERSGSQGDPQFVGAAAGDYRLSPGSPALTASLAGGAVGAYETGGEVIGIVGP